MTKRQKEIYDFIVSFKARLGYAPSFREIAEHFHLSSASTVHEHIAHLQAHGLLRSEHNKARSLEPLPVNQFGQVINLPLVGLITAGEPIEAIEESETMAVPSSLVDNDNSFILKVRGNSMIEDGILDGDYVICERNYYPQNGDVVVALIDNTYATLKRYYREKNRIRLQPANSSMGPMFVQNPAIQGVVRSIIRRFA